MDVKSYTDWRPFDKLPVEQALSALRGGAWVGTEKEAEAVAKAVKEYTNDPTEAIATGAVKFDGGKSPIYRGGLAYFPRAISAVASVSAFGASKYAWNGWQNVSDGYSRYSDAMVRHLGYEAEGESLDPDSGLLHSAHTAWNALARLELLLKEREGLKTGPQSPDKN